MASYIQSEDGTYILQENGDKILLDFQLSARHLRPEIVIIKGRG